MSETRPFQAVDALLLLGIIVIAFTVRATFLLSFTIQQRPAGWLIVQEAQPPLGNPDTTETNDIYHLVKKANEYIDVRWCQAVLGSLTAGLYFLFARRAFRSLLVAILTGILCSVYPFWVLNTGTLEDGTLASF